ncbi:MULTISPECIES: hypothetical protein [unclassified Streptomyces]|uniref:hypothetical protein n=1 Tax=unclassified Streptomyces TaxID=2593676 RepID=UPI00403CAB87
MPVRHFVGYGGHWYFKDRHAERRDDLPHRRAPGEPRTPDRYTEDGHAWRTSATAPTRW